MSSVVNKYMANKKDKFRVIDGKGEKKSQHSRPMGVTSFAKYRDDKIQERRIEMERVIFDDQFGIQSIIEGKTVQDFKKVKIIDISTSGLSFSIHNRYATQYKTGDKMSLRFYFTDKIYVPFDCQVSNINLEFEVTKTYKRVGCKVLDGKGKLFYDMLLSYFYTGDTIPPADEGISILRELGSLDEKGPQSVSTVKVGQTYRVTLTMTVPEDRYFVGVESPLPAGLEGLDLQLKTNKQSGLPNEIQDQENSSPWWWYDDEDDTGLWRFTHREFRDDRVFLFSDYLPAGVYKYTYLVRATTPGTFRQRPARIWEMYYPETFGQTEGNLFTVKE